jgi:hypothetical protein
MQSDANLGVLFETEITWKTFVDVVKGKFLREKSRVDGDELIQLMTRKRDGLAIISVSNRIKKRKSYVAIIQQLKFDRIRCKIKKCLTLG